MDDDVFTLIPANALPAEALIGYAENLIAGNLVKAHKDLIIATMPEESSKRFLDRMGDKDKPIIITTVAQVCKWMVGEVYGGSGKGPGAT